MAERAGGELIKEARRRVGLTQLQLARRMGTGQSVIARWERGERSPTMETILRVAEICGLELQTSLVEREPTGIDRAGLARLRSLSPTERLKLAATEARNLSAFDEALRG